MTPSHLIIGQILPYLAFLLGIGGLLWRLGLWLRIPSPFRLTLYPLPERGSGRIRTEPKKGQCDQINDRHNADHGHREEDDQQMGPALGTILVLEEIHRSHRVRRDGVDLHLGPTSVRSASAGAGAVEVCKKSESNPAR